MHRTTTNDPVRELRSRVGSQKEKTLPKSLYPTLSDKDYNNTMSRDLKHTIKEEKG